MSSPELERTKRSLARERKARKELELIAESRARELYEANLKLASALEDLTAQKKRLEELSVSPIFSVDNNGLVDDWNAAAERLTGFCREDVVGHDLVTKLVPEDQQESLCAVLDAAMAGEQSTGFELQLKTKRGDTVDILLNYSARRELYDYERLFADHWLARIGAQRARCLAHLRLADFLAQLQTQLMGRLSSPESASARTIAKVGWVTGRVVCLASPIDRWRRICSLAVRYSTVR